MWETRAKKGSLLAYGWFDKMFYHTAREAGPPRASLPIQSETHDLFVSNVRPHLQYWCMPPHQGCGEGPDWYVVHRRSSAEPGEGNRILEIYEFYEYNVTGYDPEKCDGGLFA